MVLATRPIRKVNDLKGKILPTVAFGSGVDITMRAVLRKHGLEDKRDYTAIRLHSRQSELCSLTKGGPRYRNSAVRNRSRVTKDSFDQKEAFGVTQVAAWTARKPFLDKSRAVMVDFMEDSLRIVRRYLDRANSNARITKQPAERFAYVFTEMDYYHDRNMLPNLDALQKNIDLTEDLGYISGSIEVRRYADLSIIKEVAERLK
jgi:sulfonate transport system substrate-binding protein